VVQPSSSNAVVAGVQFLFTTSSDQPFPLTAHVRGLSFASDGAFSEAPEPSVAALLTSVLSLVAFARRAKARTK